MARGTQHRKRRPAQNARASAVAATPHKQRPPQWQEELFFQRLRMPRQVGVRPARRRLRARLRLLRRRLRLDRDQRRAPERLQLRQQGRHVDLEAPEQGRQASEGREGLARPRDRARAEAADAGGGDRPRALHDAAPEGPGRPRRAGVPVRDARDQLLERLRGRAAADGGAGVACLGLRARLDDAVRQGARRPDGAEGPDLVRRRDARRREAADRLHELPERPAKRGGGIPEARRAEPERRDLADPARPGRPGGAGPDDSDHRLQGVPQARADRSTRSPR